LPSSYPLASAGQDQSTSRLLPYLIERPEIALETGLACMYGLVHTRRTLILWPAEFEVSADDAELIDAADSSFGPIDNASIYVTGVMVGESSYQGPCSQAHEATLVVQGDVRLLRTQSSR
jgi:hypothetical protein